MRAFAQNQSRPIGGGLPGRYASRVRCRWGPIHVRSESVHPLRRRRTPLLAIGLRCGRSTVAGGRGHDRDADVETKRCHMRTPSVCSEARLCLAALAPRCALAHRSRNRYTHRYNLL